MKQLSTSIEEKIEPIIDGSSVSIVLSAIARICDEKAAHVLENWMDNTTAREWTKTSEYIQKLALKINC